MDQENLPPSPHLLANPSPLSSSHEDPAPKPIEAFSGRSRSDPQPQLCLSCQAPDPLSFDSVLPTCLGRTQYPPQHSHYPLGYPGLAGARRSSAPLVVLSLPLGRTLDKEALDTLLSELTCPLVCVHDLLHSPWGKRRCALSCIKVPPQPGHPGAVLTEAPAAWESEA